MFKRFSSLLRGFFGLFVSRLETRNTAALLEVEKESLRAQADRYRKAMIAHAALIERMQAQAHKLENAAPGGDPEQVALAIRLAGDLASAELFANHGRLSG